MNVALAASSEVLLSRLERAGLPVESHCRSGICGICRTNLVEGSVTYMGEPLAHVRAGQVLVCCAVAQTDVVLKI